jgi:hypothetical protein
VIADVTGFGPENKPAFLVTRTGERCLVNEPVAPLADKLVSPRNPSASIALFSRPSPP